MNVKNTLDVNVKITLFGAVRCNPLQSAAARHPDLPGQDSMISVPRGSARRSEIAGGNPSPGAGTRAGVHSQQRARSSRRGTCTDWLYRYPIDNRDVSTAGSRSGSGRCWPCYPCQPGAGAGFADSLV